MLKIVASVLMLAGLAASSDFVLVKGGLLRPGSAALRVDDFEMADHPVTNAEYDAFVRDTGHAAPLHWKDGRIPAPLADHPVIFVNRYDAADYVAWRTRREGRIYRLPTASEFEFAARGGQPAAVYPWGKDNPAGKANYDAAGERTFAQWPWFIQPVKSYAPNPFGLYDLAGNVWQMVDTYPDMAIAQYKYRIESPASEEGAIAGGSWARSEYYLRCGVRGSASPGIRHPDLGFRVVREPEGATHFHRLPRRVIAAPAGSGAVYLGWQFLSQDAEQTGFHVYIAPPVATRPASASIPRRCAGRPTSCTEMPRAKAAPGTASAPWMRKAGKARPPNGPPSTHRTNARGWLPSSSPR